MKFLLLFLLIASPVFASSPLLEQAGEKKASGDYEGARKIYQDILTEEPKNEASLLGLAETYYWEGNYQKSIDTYQKLLEQNPAHLKAMTGIAKSYLAKGDQQKADVWLEKARRLNSEDPETQSLSSQVGKKTKVKIHGGYFVHYLSYAQDAEGAFQEVSITKEESYGFGLKTIYLSKFSKRGFETALFGHYFFLEKTKAFAGFNFAPSVAILPQQGYTIGLAHTLWKVTPEVSYSFQDWAEANQHFLRGNLFFDPFFFLRVGGGYELKKLTFGGNSQVFHNGIASVRVSPLEWLQIDGFYKKVDQGFEGGRAPSPYVNYSAHIGGGGITLDFVANSLFSFTGSLEERNNGESVSVFMLGVGISL